MPSEGAAGTLQTHGPRRARRRPMVGETDIGRDSGSHAGRSVRMREGMLAAGRSRCTYLLVRRCEATPGGRDCAITHLLR